MQLTSREATSLRASLAGQSLARTAVLALIAAQLSLAGDSIRDRGVAEFGQGRYTTALRDLQQAASEQPNDSEAAAFLALTQAATGDCVTARPALIAAVDRGVSPLDRMAGLAAAKCDSAAGQAVKALSTLEQLKKRYPDNADLLYLSAKIHMQAFNAATLAMFQRTPASFRVHELSAEIFEVQNRYEDAAGEYRRAIELNPAAPDLHFHLGRALILQSHSPEALQQAAAEFRAELQLNPEDSACEFELGQIADVQGKEAEARAHLEHAQTLSPNFVQALISLGRLYSRDKQPNQAIAVLQRAVTLQPDNEAAHYALLSAYRAVGQMDRAKSEKAILDGLRKAPEGEFSEFLKKLGDKPPEQ